MAVFGGIRLFVGFLCACGLEVFFNVDMAYLVLYMYVKLQSKKFYCNNANRGLQLSTALPLQITRMSPGICQKTHLISGEDQHCDCLCKELSVCCTSAVTFSVWSTLLNMNYKHERESEVF